MLTVGSSVICSHSGTFTFTAGHKLLTVDGQAVVRQSELQNAVITGCKNTVANLGQKPCLAIASIIAGLAHKLTVGGEAAALDTATGLTNSTPPGTWSVTSAGQTKLEAL
ncbi:hypothetical protein [Dactylosporangium sp. CA-092794]|uniref:hypothetical protein n=1 Tax=Dactylosporangium sp. CA-092794 TaxID=3239929 RepID=UPI003D8EFB8B